LKGAHFIELCNQNNTPHRVPAEHHRLHGRPRVRARGITKDGAKMIMAQVGSRVPKFTVMCNGSFGAGNYGMCGRAYDGASCSAGPTTRSASWAANRRRTRSPR
jgi:3-methylcrotonyl-CoA carboxylase beta subunit